MAVETAYFGTDRLGDREVPISTLRNLHLRTQKKHKAALTGPSSAFQSASDQRWPRPGASDPIRPSMALKNEKPTPLTPPKSDSVGKVRSFWPSNDLPKIYTIVAPAKPTVSDNPANDSDLPRNSRQVAMVDDKVKVGGAVAALLSSSSLQTTIVRDAKPSIMEPPAKHHKAHPCSCIPSWHPTVDAEVSYDGLKSKTKSVDTVEEAVKNESLDRMLLEPCIPSWHPTVDAEVSYDGLKSKTKSVDTVEEAVKTVSLDRELSEPDRMAIAAILL